MKLYYAAGTCSFAAHIAAREAGIPLELEKVDIFKTPHMTATGQDFSRINPKGYVPALLLDDGSLLSEGAAIVQYLADLNPDAGLAPPAGTMERYRLQSWLSFVAAELHKRDRINIEGELATRPNQPHCMLVSMTCTGFS